MRANHLKSRLSQGACAWGTSLEDCLDPEMPLLLRRAGLNFFFIDTEHSPAHHAQIQALCRTAAAAGITPLVRVTEGVPHLITRMLDVGAQGVIVPRVTSAEAAAMVVDCVKFTPLGHRGFGLRSIVTDLEMGGAAEHIAACNRESMVVLQIESVEGLENVERIAAVPHIDALFIGPYDLSLSMGIVEEFEHPRFWHAVDRVFAAARAAGIAAGLQSRDIPLLKKARERGGRFLLYGSDSSVLYWGYRGALRELGVEEAPAQAKPLLY